MAVTRVGLGGSRSAYGTFAPKSAGAATVARRTMSRHRYRYAVRSILFFMGIG